MEKIKVFLSDSQVLFREGIHFILSGEDEYEVIGESTNNEDAFKSIETNIPNVAVLSMQDPRASGPDITRRIKRSFPSISVILTTDKKEDEKIFAAIRSGASACIIKDIDPDHLLNTIKSVAQGNIPLADDLLKPELASMALTEFQDLAALNEQVDNLLANLAPKESQILTNAAAGSTLDQITAKLDINEENVHRNLRLIFNKLVANDQARAIIDAAQRSLPAIIRGVGRKTGASAEFVTRAEFNEFKESLMERLKAIIGQLR
jgi:two-component system, NarL family, response regulator DevR